MKTKRIIYNTAVRFVQEIRTAAANMRTLGTSRFHTRRFRYNNLVFRRYSVDKNPEQPTVNCTELLASFLDDVESAIPQLEQKMHTAAFKSARQGIKQMLPGLKAIVREAYLQAGALGYDILTTRTECGFARLECVKR